MHKYLEFGLQQLSVILYNILKCFLLGDLNKQTYRLADHYSTLIII